MVWPPGVCPFESPMLAGAGVAPSRLVQQRDTGVLEPACARLSTPDARLGRSAEMEPLRRLLRRDLACAGQPGVEAAADAPVVVGALFGRYQLVQVLPAGLLVAAHALH